MPAEDVIGRIAQSAGGAFRFGRGIVSRSSVVILVFMIAIAIASFGLPGLWKLAGVGVGALVFLVWYFASLWFTVKHPDVALLDGAEWSAWKQFEASAKGLPSPSAAAALITDPAYPQPILPDVPEDAPSLPGSERQQP